MGDLGARAFKALRSGNAWAARGRILRALGLEAMDVGAVDFEQSLPLLQELVAGADFVGKVPGVAGLVGDSLGTGVWPGRRGGFLFPLGQER